MEETAQYIHKFVPADYYVIGGYLLMLVSVGFIVKKLCGNVKDYFIGGNKIPWWLAGGSCFMMSFSAWTFTGAAGFAFKHGILICLLFYFNVFSYLFAGRFIAAKCRQTRKITFAQIIYDRFGRLGEQFFLWIQVPNMLFCGAIWMVGLGTFISAAFGVPIPLTIIVCGAVILIYSTISGSWAVMTTDFLQSIILMVLTTVIFFLTLGKIGGIGGIVENVEPSKLRLFSSEHTWVWALAYFGQTFFAFNTVMSAPRYLAVTRGKDAKKVAYLVAALFLIGPPIWFLPPIAASHFFPNIAEILPQLKHPQDAAYVLIGLSVLPEGLAGLLVMVVFAATLSIMDSSVNQNAALVSLNLYKPFFRPNASEREMFIASRVFNVLCGMAVTGGGLLLSMQGEMALFDLMVFLSASLILPISIPCVLIYWVKKTPHFSAIVSVLLSMAYSMITFMKDYSLPVRVWGTIAIGVSAFFLCGLFWKDVREATKQKIFNFYKTMNTPIDAAREVEGAENVAHLYVVGVLTLIVSAGLSVVAFFPNDTRGRIIILATSLLIFIIGITMYGIGKRSKERIEQTE
jgi:solute:Na+ symporter, SSS family